MTREWSGLRHGAMPCILPRWCRLHGRWKLRFGPARCGGAVPQIGVDFGRVLLVATYNTMFGSDIELRPSSDGEVRSISQDFISIGLLYRPDFGKNRR